ncbi:MAG TPA: hypothetical protein PK573_07460 [Spirochaetota bacterium]|nr:hypothetical protein [Spirochaetota bacterium]HRZ26486.1 hypothetical protein [Spirochaetota bacterium]HSA15572.1 hypothetical protein [Spirochaetota bacterium]
MYVHSSSAFICDPVDTIDGMKEDLKKYTDYYFRRINKFIMLSLMGVHQCIHASPVSPSAAVYLATENGNLGDTENVLEQIYRKNSFPKPFNFINTMSNTASFYVAQSLKTLGRSITLSSKNVSFERALELAKTDFELNHITEALVGGVDEAVASLDERCAKNHESCHNIRMVEGSCWLRLKPEKDGAAGEIIDVRTFAEMKAAARWIEGAAGSPVTLAFGIFTTPADRIEWRHALPGAEEFDYLSGYGYYDTAAALAISAFFLRFSGRSLVHANMTADGQHIVTVCKSY